MSRGLGDVYKRQALGDGEDYELMLTVNSQNVDALIAAWNPMFPDTSLTKIGELCDQGSGVCFEQTGWQHFST